MLLDGGMAWGETSADCRGGNLDSRGAARIRAERQSRLPVCNPTEHKSQVEVDNLS